MTFSGGRIAACLTVVASEIMREDSPSISLDFLLRPAAQSKKYLGPKITLSMTSKESLHHHTTQYRLNEIVAVSFATLAFSYELIVS